jgi:hypothetical protein
MKGVMVYPSTSSDVSSFLIIILIIIINATPLSTSVRISTAQQFTLPRNSASQGIFATYLPTHTSNMAAPSINIRLAEHRKLITTTGEFWVDGKLHGKGSWKDGGSFTVLVEAEAASGGSAS